MSSKVFIELEWEQIESIIVKELSKTKDGLKKDFIRRKKKEIMPLFSLDDEIEEQEVARHIESFDTVLKYYGGNLG